MHRDIKGANILTTKDGYFIIIIYYIKYRVVKLADFGVATRLTDDEKSFSLVGTYFNYLYFNIQDLTGWHPKLSKCEGIYQLLVIYGHWDAPLSNFLLEILHILTSCNTQHYLG